MIQSLASDGCSAFLMVLADSSLVAMKACHRMLSRTCSMHLVPIVNFLFTISYMFCLSSCFNLITIYILSQIHKLTSSSFYRFSFPLPHWYTYAAQLLFITASCLFSTQIEGQMLYTQKASVKFVVDVDSCAIFNQTVGFTKGL